jgi:DNA-binding MarR family transcriptional regulator
VLLAGRELSTAAVMFHTAIAEQCGLSATESKTLDLLQRFGPLTPRELSERSGLAPPSVTGLIDRLERKGAARRRPHPKDGRRHLVEINAEYVAKNQALFDPFVRSMLDLCSQYDDEQLEMVARFMTEATRRQQAATRALTS